MLLIKISRFTRQCGGQDSKMVPKIPTPREHAVYNLLPLNVRVTCDCDVTDLSTFLIH